MARKKRTTQEKEVQDYRHDTATRKNNPPAGIAALYSGQSRGNLLNQILPDKQMLTKK